MCLTKGEGTLLDREFDGIIDPMPEYLSKLNDCPPIGMDTSEERRILGKRLLADAGISICDRDGKTTDPGIYVLYEGDKPMYVGRSDHLKDRLLSHGRPSSGSNSASFAFILAKEDCEITDPDHKSMSRPELEIDLDFKSLFEAAKERVRKMPVRAVGIQDPIEQTLFEVYAHLQLGTPHNSFENH